MNRYWVGGSGTWDNITTTHWSASSGGVGGASVPGVGDTAIFDANSGGGTVTPNYNLSVLSLNISAFAGTLDFSVNNNSPTLGSFDGFGVGSPILKMGSGTWTLTGTSTVWDFRVSGTLEAGTSTIKITDTSATIVQFLGGSGKIYHNLWFARGTSTGTNLLDNVVTFANLKDDGTAAHTMLFAPTAVITVSSWNVSGTPGNLITLDVNVGPTFSLIKSGGGQISADYLNIQHSIATPDLTWYAGINSVDNQGVATPGSGWIFTPPVPPAQGSFLSLF